MTHIKINTALQLTLIVILAFVVYGNSIGGQFIWDDYFQVKDNAYIKSWSNLGGIFSQKMGAGSGYDTNFYRPLQTLTYMLDYSLYKLNPAGFHITSILLHALTGLAIYWLVNILFLSRPFSLLAALLFVAHPVNTESVSFISDRAESLGALFILLSLAFYIKYLRAKDIKLCILSVISFIFALLSKENSLVLPALLLLYHYIFRAKLEPGALIAPFVTAILFVLARSAIIGPLLLNKIRPGILIERVPGFFAAIADYLKIAILPLNLHLEYSYEPFYFYQPKVIAGISITALLIACAFIKRKDSRLISFSIFWFFITLLPVSNIYPVNDSYMAERWMYLPLIGLILIPAGALIFLYNIKRYRWIGRLFIIALLALYSILTIKQNAYWSDPISFSKRSLEYNPRSSKLYNQLGLEYYFMGSYEKAISAYQKAIELDPHIEGLRNNLGNAYDALKEEIAAGYRKTEGEPPGLANQYYENGNEYMAIGRTQEAMASYGEALKLDPDNPVLYVALGNACTIMGRYKEAVDSFKEAIKADPDLAVVHNNLALAYYYDKQYEPAIAHCDKAVELGYKVSPRLLELLEPHRK